MGKQSFPHVNKFTQKREIKCAVLSAPPSTVTHSPCATIAPKIASQYQTSILFSPYSLFEFFSKHLSESDKVTNLWCNPPECFKKLQKGKKRKDYWDSTPCMGQCPPFTHQPQTPLSLHHLNKPLQAGHLGCRRKRCRYSEMASQCLQRKARRMTRSSVVSVRLRVFIKGTTQLATVDTNTKRTAITASSTLISFPSRVRAVAFSKPSSCTTCCCCCCSSILEIRVWQASSASCRSETKLSVRSLWWQDKIR